MSGAGRRLWASVRPGLWLALASLFLATQAWADAEVLICYNYGCLDQVRVSYSEARLTEIRQLMARAKDDDEERAALATAIGRLYAWAGEQSLIRNDKGGDYADMGEEGRMDCIDHAASTTRLLQLMESRGFLRFHRVVEQARRTRILIMQHFSAVIEERQNVPAMPKPEPVPLVPTPALKPDEWLLDGGSCFTCGARSVEQSSDDAGKAEIAVTPQLRRWVVDSWFYDNGSPAVIMPLEEWLDGGGPMVP